MRVRRMRLFGPGTIALVAFLVMIPKKYSKAEFLSIPAVPRQEASPSPRPFQQTPTTSPTTPLLTPTLAPTRNASPSPRPSQQAPTIPPTTFLATPLPTVPPTSTPTSSPSGAPTRSPSNAPTKAPTLAPTKGSKPTGSPLPVQHLEPTTVNLLINGIILPLSEDALRSIEQVTSQQIENSIFSVLGADQLHSLAVDVGIISLDTGTQQDTSGTVTARDDPNRWRRLDSVGSVGFTLVVIIWLQSVVETHDVNRYIIGAFNDDDEKALYLSTLKATGDPSFILVDSVTISQVNDTTPAETGSSDGNNQGGSGRAVVIIVCVVVVVVLLGIAAFFFDRKERRSKVKNVERRSKDKNIDCDASSLQESEVSRPEGINSEIIAASMITDLSSLGDPLPYQS